MAEMTKLRVNEAIARRKPPGLRFIKKRLLPVYGRDAPKAHNKLI